jgi:hypothetical protein
MKRLTIISLSAALLFAAVAVGLFVSRPPDHSPQLAELEQKLQRATSETATLKKELAMSKTNPGAGLAPAPSDSSLAASGAPPKESGGPTAPAAMSQMMKDPKMREAMKGAAVMQIEMQYAKLIGKLSMNETETTHFKKLLGDRFSAKTDMGFEMMDASVTKEQRKAVTDQYEASKKASDAAIKEFLNDNADFATFMHWEDTEPERMQMMLGKTAFDAASAPLSPEQEEQLISLMAEVRKRPSDLPDLNDPQQIDPGMMTDDFTKRLAAAFDQQQRSVLEGAAGFLAQPQIEALKKMQEQMRTLNEAGLKMSKSMMAK